MIRLIAKEIRQLQPIAYLWFAILVFGYGIQFFTERVDENTFGDWCEGYCDYNSSAAVAVFIILLALVTAYSLFPREHDEGTIDLLRSLPVSRKSIFIAKVLSAWLLLVGFNALSYSLDVLLLSSNPESMGGRFYPQVWFTLLWRDSLFLFIILSHGVLLSWFRTLGLILYFIYLLLLVLAESYLGTSGHWSVFTLLANEYHGSDLIVNSKGLLIHAVVAVFILVFAYRLWDRTESGKTNQKTASRSYRFVQFVGGLLGFILLAGAMLYQVESGTGSESAATNVKIAATDHYRFAYPPEKESVVNYLLEFAEDDLSHLSELMGVSELPRIRVDLTAQSEHAAGLAKWKKIQIDLDSFEDDISQRRVLIHEAAHVLQAIESDRSLSDNYPALKFFIEGMAQHLSFDVVPETSRRQSNWALASVAMTRQNIDFNHMIDAQGFAESFDADLHYSLGDLWVDALVNTCGQLAPSDFVRATGREGAPRGLPAALFWRDTMRAIDCDLDTVNAAWIAKGESLYGQIDESVFPEFTKITTTKDAAADRIILRAVLSDYKLPSTDAQDASDDEATNRTYKTPQRFSIRIGKAATNLAAGTDAVYRGQLVQDGELEAVVFSIPLSAISGTRFRYQMGFLPSKDSRYYYESWRRGTVPLPGKS